MVKSNYIPGTALICVYGVEESAVLNQDLHNVFISKIYLWDVDQRASRILKQIFEYVNQKFLVKRLFFITKVGCCGADGGVDFVHVHKPIPFEVSLIQFFLIFISLNLVSSSC